VTIRTHAEQNQVEPRSLARGELKKLAQSLLVFIGCGGGILTESMAMRGANVTGIDMSEEAIYIAESHAKQYNPGIINYKIDTAENMAELFPAKFDVVTCMELLEHVPDPVSLIKACAKLVKHDGHIFFSTINRNLKAYLFIIIGAEYLLKMLPKGTHDYGKFVRPSELASWARKGGLVVQKFKGMQYNLLSKDYHLSDDISVNYLAYCQHTI
jgi:2-polyprenyl-6-hydroxyphenyl methylase/3-demethylubiquinone-9 3-methyltransferase